MTSSWQQIQEAGNRAFCSGLFETALNNYLQALDLAKKCADLSFISDSSRGLAKTYLQLGKIDEGLQAAKEADATDREFWGYENQQVSEDMFLMAEALRRQENFTQARELFERVLELYVALFGEMHDHTLEVLVRLVWIDLAQGRSESLENTTRRAVEIFATLHPAGAFTKALNIKFLLQPYMEQNRQQEAELIATRIQQALRAVLGGAHPEIRQALADCSAVMKSANRHMAAWHLQARADVIEKKGAVDRWAEQPSGPSIIVDGIPVLVHQSNPELAKEHARQIVAARAIKGATATAVHTLTWQQLCDQAEKALASGLYDRALEFYLDALDTARRADDQSSVSETLRQLTEIYLEIGMAEEGQKSSTEAAEIDRAFWGNENAHIDRDEFLLAESLRRQEKLFQAREFLQSVLLLRTKLYGKVHSETLSALLRLIWLDLQEDNDSLVEHTQQAAVVFSQCHPAESFSQLLDLTFLLRPYIEQNRRPEVELMCQKIQSAARSAFGDSAAETAATAQECATAMRALDRASNEAKLKMQSQPAEKIPASDYRSSSPAADSAISHHDDFASVSLLRQHANRASAEPEALPDSPVNLLRHGLNLAGVKTDAKQFISLSIGSSVAIGLCSAAIYCAAGYIGLSIESGAIAFLTGIGLILFVVTIMLVVRQYKLVQQLPNVFEIIVTLLQAGTPISEALEQVSKTSPMPIRAEFERVVVALKEGKSFSQAFAEMMSYVKVPQLAQLTDAINANRSSGGNLAKQVSIIAKDLRESEKEGLVLRKSLVIVVLLSGLVVLAGLRLMCTLAFSPAAGAPLLDSAITKVILFLIFAAPVVLMFAAKRARKNNSSNQPLIRLPAFIHKWKMKEVLRNELSKFLDLVVIYVQSGVSLPAAVQKVRDEASSSCPKLCQELDSSLHNLTSFKSSLPLAFRRIGEQYDVSELVTLAATLDAASHLGGSISYQLMGQSQSLRVHLSRSRMAAAASAFSVAMLIGMALFSLFYLFSKMLEHHP